MRWIVPFVTAGVAALLPPPASAAPPDSGVPAHCVEHTSLNGGADAPGDYRCAGLAVPYHAGGVRHSPELTWAGQWLFVDETGRYRVGSCTFHRGTHPNVLDRSRPTTQVFPNDPTGALGSYLTWRYGATTDPLTAAALWAVLHYYAQDAGGPSFAVPAGAPLVPSLTALAAASGRDDLQQRALALHAEAERFAGEWSVEVSVSVDGDVAVVVRAGVEPVAGHLVKVRSGEQVVEAATDDDGVARLAVPVAPGLLAVEASTESPGPLQVYLGTPAKPDPQGAQTLATAGEPVRLVATAEVDVPPPSTTTTAPDPEPAPTSEPAPLPEPVPLPAPAVSLPAAGGGANGVAHLATAVLVAGVGLAGSVRRARTPG